ncbi:nucleotide-binding protein [Vibrio parahaemolyticus]|uniref:nucleotide-binding protein n=1 Tax=Vibrio parahaemolyticus TaxID=670 RepID=UPI00226BBD7E|nr:nucleotide-binding protein [Vibrio parahaemolyticus]MCX8794108.1 nucleotide-binding protein [Vibrio parahaemolyticus]
MFIAYYLVCYMADLTTLEKKKLERYFGMESGYFSNFSNNSLELFVAEHLSIEIYDEKYNLGSGSKANRVRALWQLESNDVIAKFLTAVMEQADFEKDNSYSYTGNTNETLKQECLEIIARLQGTTPQPQPQPQPQNSITEPAQTQAFNWSTPTMKKKVFIVHGHDELTKEKVARFISQVGLEPIILHEQVSGSQTIIEKIERYADQVCFAIVLYTPCDRGAKASERTPMFRARQNVVFEHGYFIAKLGRSKVTAIVKGNIELPNDFSGVVYVPFDESEAWKLSLAREMKGAGCEIDLSALV